MTLDPEAIRRIIREERENAKREDERERRDKERDDEIAELRKLVNRKPDHEAEPDDPDADHEPVL